MASGAMRRSRKSNDRQLGPDHFGKIAVRAGKNVVDDLVGRCDFPVAAMPGNREIVVGR
jgi:hypothetical protein